MGKNKKPSAPKKKNDGKNPPAPEKKTRPPRGHRQKGAGTARVGKGTIVYSQEMKEWQRTPKQLIHEDTTNEEAKPFWSRANGKPAPTRWFRNLRA